MSARHRYFPTISLSQVTADKFPFVCGKCERAYLSEQGLREHDERMHPLSAVNGATTDAITDTINDATAQDAARHIEGRNVAEV